MTERERLIELLDTYNPGLKSENIADYLLKNGVVALPCKVGDVVYDISDGTAYATRVLYFVYLGDHWACRTVSGYPNCEEFGERIFITKEEAQKALERSKNNISKMNGCTGENCFMQHGYDVSKCTLNDCPARTSSDKISISKELIFDSIEGTLIYNTIAYTANGDVWSRFKRTTDGRIIYHECSDRNGTDITNCKKCPCWDMKNLECEVQQKIKEM